MWSVHFICLHNKSLKTKGAIINRKSKKDRHYNGQKKKDRQYNGQKKKDRQYNGQKKKDRQHNGQKKKGQTMIYKTLHRKLQSEQHDHH